MSHTIAIELAYKPATRAYSERLLAEWIEEEVILAGAILKELLRQNYDLDLLDPEVNQWLELNAPEINGANADGILLPNIEQAAWGRLRSLLSKLNRRQAQTFKNENSNLSQWPELADLDSIEQTAHWHASEIVNSDIPFPNKYEECIAFLKEHWRNHQLIQKFFQDLGVKGSVELMIEISLGPLGCAAGARYLGLALFALNSARKLTAMDLNNLLPHLSEVLATPVVSNRARANLFLAFSIGFGDKEEFIKPLTDLIAPQMLAETMADSIRSFVYANEYADFCPSSSSFSKQSLSDDVTWFLRTSPYGSNRPSLSELNPVGCVGG